VAGVDATYKILKINTGRTNEKSPVDDVIRFCDLLDVSGKDIVDIDAFLGNEEFSEYSDC